MKASPLRSLVALILLGCSALPAHAFSVRGTGTAALAGHDLTDPEDDGDPGSNVNYNATFSASEESNFTGTAFGQGAFNVFDNRLGGGGDKWCCGTENNFPTNAISIDATFMTGKVLRRFTLSSGEDAGERDPRIWQIQGSNDGVNFTTIYSRNNPTTPVWTDRSQVVEFAAGIDYAVPAAYTTIRFICTATGATNGARFQLGEIEYLDTAASLVVTTTTDENDGTSDPTAGTGTSLREALAYAATLSGPQTITFSSSTGFGAVNFHDGVAHTITLGGTELAIASDVTITGPGADKLAVSGNMQTRVFKIAAGAFDVVFDGLTVTGGLTTGAGGGISSDSTGSVTVSNSTLSGNSTDSSGGGIYNLGTGDVTVSNSTLSGNSADIHGGGIYNTSTGSVTVTNSTLSGNSAGSNGGGILNVLTGSVTVANSTLSGNSAGSGGGGIFNFSTGSVTVSNSIFKRGTLGLNFSGTIVSLGHNLSDDAAGGDATTAPGGALNQPGDIRNTVPLLGPLQNNGGPTFTHALLPGSPAIDAGDDALIPLDPETNQPFTTDQRGLGFTRIVQGKPTSMGAIVDIGAFEVQGVSINRDVLANGLYLDVSDAPLDLTGPTIGANPPGGTFSGPGVVGGFFYAETLDPGAYQITYTTTTPDAYGNTGSVTFTIRIYAAAPYVRIIATSAKGGLGIDVPGEPAGTKFTDLGTPSMDDGAVGALVSFQPPGGAELDGIFIGNAFTASGSILSGMNARLVRPLGIVVREGDPAPGVVGTFATFGEPVFGGVAFAFSAKLAGAPGSGDTGLWSTLRAIGLGLAAGEGMDAPDGDGVAMPGVVFDKFLSYALSADGQSLTFIATLKGAGVKGSNKTGIWQQMGMVTRLIFRTGDTFRLDSGDSAVKSLKLFVPAKTIPGQRRSYASGSGRVFAYAKFAGRREALLVYSDFGFFRFTEVALENTNVGHPGLPSGNRDGWFAMRAGLSVGAPYTNRPGKVTGKEDKTILTGSNRFNISIFAQEGSPVSGSIPDVFTAFDEPAFNDNYYTAFFAKVKAPGLPSSQRNVLIYDGAPTFDIRVLARTGTPAAELTGGELWKDFTAMALPDSNYGPVFLAKLNGPGVKGTNGIGLWATDLDGTVRLLLRTGDVISIGGVDRTVSLITTLGATKDSPGQGRYVDQQGNVSALIKFTDRSTALVHFGMPTTAY